MAITETVDEAYKLRKKANNGLVYAFYWHLSFLVARVSKRLSISPNTLSVAGLVFSIIATPFFLLGTDFGNITGSVMFFLAVLMDCADGKLARLTGNTTYMGIWLDFIVDYIRRLFIYVPISYALFQATGESYFFLLGFLLTSLFLAYEVLKIRYDLFPFAQTEQQSIRGSTFHKVVKQFVFIEGIEPLSLLLASIIGIISWHLWTWSFGAVILYVFVAVYYGRTIAKNDRIQIKSTENE